MTEQLDPTNDPTSDQYIPAYRRGGDLFTLGGTLSAPFNGQLTQLRPRADKRPAVLAERAEGEANRNKRGNGINIR